MSKPVFITQDKIRMPMNRAARRLIGDSTEAILEPVVGEWSKDENYYHPKKSKSELRREEYLKKIKSKGEAK